MSHVFGLLSFLFIFAGLLMAYWLFLRPILKRWSAMAPVFAAEQGFFSRLWTVLAGLKTKLASWIVMFGGGVLAVHDLLMPVISSVDTTPLLSQIPAQYLPLILIAIGAFFRWLRKVTKGPEAT